MCRMLLALGKIDLKTIIEDAALMAKDLIFDHEHNQRGGRGSLPHANGWGLAYLQRNQFIVKKTTLPLFKDKNKAKYYPLNTSFLLLHARYATVGNVNIHNNHPFHFKKKNIGDFIFCHNGTIEEKISHDHQFTMQGTTDSERLFYAILTNFVPSRNPKTITKTINQYNYPIGCNIILATEEKTYISINCRTCPKYVEMHLLQDKDKLIISSEPLPHIKGIWTTLKSGTLLEINNKTRIINNKTPKISRIACC